MCISYPAVGVLVWVVLLCQFEVGLPHLSLLVTVDTERVTVSVKVSVTNNMLSHVTAECSLAHKACVMYIVHVHVPMYVYTYMYIALIG